MGRRTNASNSAYLLDVTSTRSGAYDSFALSYVYYFLSSVPGSQRVTIHPKATSPNTLYFSLDTDFGKTKQRYSLAISNVNGGNVLNRTAPITTETEPVGTWNGHAATVVTPTITHRAFRGEIQGTNLVQGPGFAGGAVGDYRVTGIAFALQTIYGEIASWFGGPLTDSDLVALTRFWCPLLVSPTKLVTYLPLGGAYGQGVHDQDLVGQMDPTLNPAIAVWDKHPPVIYPCECLCC